MQFLIYILCFFIISRNILIPTIKYDFIKIPNIINNNEILEINNSFFNEINYEKLEKIQNIIFKKIKMHLNVPYINVSHARITNNNYDAQTYHRDIKPFGYCKKYPKVYTIILFLDNAQHFQGGEHLFLNKGDCLIFNSFNLHKGGKMQIFNNSKKRGVIQFFNVFFELNEYYNFKTKHKYVTYSNLDFYYKFDSYLKIINSYFDTRCELELLNLMPYIINHQYINKNKQKNISYITFIDQNKKIITINNVDYYESF